MRTWRKSNHRGDAEQDEWLTGCGRAGGGVCWNSLPEDAKLTLESFFPSWIVKVGGGRSAGVKS